MKALVVEDDVALARLVSKGLERDGFEVDCVATGGAALEMLASGEQHDVVLLDIQLPDGSGLEVCRRLRLRGDRRPVLIITGRSLVTDRVHGLDVGADDYVTKPFAVEELLARVRAVLRRSGRGAGPIHEAGDLSLHPAERRVERGGTPIELTAREFDLLELLIENAGFVVSRERILDEVWTLDYTGGPRVIDVYVSYLRAKIDEPFGCHSIETVRGVGYRLRSDGR